MIPTMFILAVKRNSMWNRQVSHQNQLQIVYINDSCNVHPDCKSKE